jgi:hypothetical protein
MDAAPPRVLIATCAWAHRRALLQWQSMSTDAQPWRALPTQTGTVPSNDAPVQALLLCDLPAGGDVNTSMPLVSLWIGERIGAAAAGGAPRGAGGMLCYFMNIDAQHEAEFNDWYDTEHIPRLAAVPGVLAARRFRAIRGRQKYVAIYHYSDPHLTGSAAWRAAAGTPWTARIARRRYDNERLLCTPAVFM